MALHGSLGLRYRTRWNGESSDQDLSQLLGLELGNAARDPWSLSLSAEAREDIDGIRPGSTSDAYYEIEDSSGDALAARLYHAYVDLHSIEDLETLRVGRQTLVDTPETAWFDGARVETRELGGARARLGAYGGVPVEYDTGSYTGSALYGVFAEAQPWTGSRVRGEWMHADDDVRLGHSDDLLGVGLWQSLWTNLRLEGHYTRLEEVDRDVTVRASWSASDSDLVVRLNWYRLCQPQDDLALPFDPYYETLQELEPFQQYGLQVSKSVTEHLHAQAGYDARRLEEAQDEGIYNHDYDRGWLTLSATGVLPAGLDASLTGELWDSHEDDMSTYGAELSRRFEERLDAAVGTYYSLYEYDLFLASEKDHVRVWYLKLVLDRNAPLRVDLRYEFEDDDIDQYHDLRLGVTWRF